jgi:uncharacterized membrane protein
MKKFFKYFFQGLIFIAPLGLTIYIIYFLFNFLDGIIQQYIELWFKIKIPGLGLLALFLLISFVGFLGQSIIFRPVRKLMGALIEKTPVLKVIYSSIRDLLNAFVGKEKKFNQPVLVKVNTISELEKVGFLTQEDLSDLGIKDKVAVYFPHSYNFSGELFIVPTELVKPFDMSPADAMKFIVSGGVARG